MVFGIVLAGGKGSRMGNTDMPKQFMKLGTKPIFKTDYKYTLAVSPLDCMGCGVCVDVCPTKPEKRAIEKIEICFCRSCG